jgi:hypothetical protein
MHLTENRCAQGMGREFAAIFGRNIHYHGLPVARENPFCKMTKDWLKNC